MAKQIKAIKCPNCSSVQKTEIKTDHYRCDNCQTEYFLDSDDININVKHHQQANNLSQFFNNKSNIIITIAVVLFCLTVFLTISLVNKFVLSSEPRSVSHTTTTGTSSSTVNNIPTTQTPPKV